MENELIHYGVLGMKWGRRRGKKETFKKLKAKRNKNSRAKALKMMTDHELDIAIKRLTNEKRYIELTDYVNRNNPSILAKLKRNLKSVGLFTSKTIYTNAITQGTKTGLQALTKKMNQN